jgi:hypothetical protein
LSDTVAPAMPVESAPAKSKKGLLMDRETPAKAKAVPTTDAVGRTNGWRIAAVAGLVFGIAGWTDALLLWYPLGFGNPEWEFATASSTFDAIPLGTIGLVALLAGCIGLGGRKRVLGVSALFAVIAVALFAVYVLFALSVTVAWGAIDPGMRVVLIRAVTKTSVLAFAYIFLYGWLAWIGRQSFIQLKGRVQA